MESIMLKFRSIFLFLLAVAFWSCEEEFIPDIDESSQEFIVEGYIEDGANSLPPFVVVSRSLPFFGRITADDIFDLQIQNAEVSVRLDGESYSMPPVCLSDLPEEVRDQIKEEINFLPVSEESDFCLYIDLFRNIPILRDTSYHLEVLLSTGETIRARTTIPQHVPIDSFRFTRPPGSNQNDTMARLLITVSDPEGPHFYRYLTAGEGQGFLPGFASVTDDLLFDGQTFDFPLQKAASPEELEDLEPENFGLYTRGDSIRIRWLNIDEDHFNFWNTFEFNLNNQGPFSSYTRVRSNVEGALGIWGGYSSSEYILYVPTL